MRVHPLVFPISSAILTLFQILAVALPYWTKVDTTNSGLFQNCGKEGCSSFVGEGYLLISIKFFI